ncbi:MAG: DUF3520 domain-containing protein [bacterium]|nr:DUF3520 domain-containing protein [bacterium]
MKKKITLLLTALFAITLCCFMLPDGATAQEASTTGTIHGQVTDPDGVPLPGITVFLKSPCLTISKLTTVTNARGRYRFIGLSAGTYQLTFRLDGCNTLVRGKLPLKPGENLRINAAMTSKSVSESVVVCGKAPVIDSRKTSGSTSFTPGISRNRAASGNRNKSRRAFRKHRQMNSHRLDGVNMQSVPKERIKSESFNTEEYGRIVESKFKEALDTPLSTFSIDVDTASYTNCRRFLNSGQMPPKDSVRIEEFINYFNYDYPEPKDEHPFSVITEVSRCPWNTGHQLIHIGLQGKKTTAQKAPVNNLVFLIDVSGSMQSANKLPLLQSAFRLLVKQLSPHDRVALVVYAGAAGVVLPSTSAGRTDVILAAIDQLRAGGSTAGGAGIRLAYKIASENFIEKGNNRVILATDGDFNIGISSTSEMVRLLEKKREKGVFLTVLGFGMGNYKDNRMEQLADKGNGNYFYIDNILEAKKVLVRELCSTLFTIAKDVKIQVEFNPALVKAYRLVGYDNRVLAKEDFNDDKKDAGELGAGHTVTALYEIIPAASPENSGNSVDTLKYTETRLKASALKGKELGTVKLRYKKPKGKKSRLLKRLIPTKESVFAKTSEAFRFSGAVAQFALLLRDSSFKGDASYQSVLNIARGAMGKDEYGYRAEFRQLVEKCKLMKEASASRIDKNEFQSNLNR